MANFRFTIDIGAQFNEVTRAREAVQSLTLDLQKVKSGQTDLRVDSTEVKLAEVYLQALNNAITKVEREGGDLGTVLANEFQRLRVEANLTEQQVEELNRDLEQTEMAARRASSGLNALSRSAKIATQNIRATSGQLDRLKNNMQEGFGQTLAFGTIGAIGAAITSAFTEVTRLDEAMTNISIVSGKSREEMEAYRDAAGEAASILGTTARDYLEASLIYEQQGGKAADYAQELAKSTIIASNITGEEMGQMSEYITAVMNGFDMLSTEGDQAGMKIADVLSNLGAVSGSGLNEMAEALQRTATVAKNSGYDFEDISAAIATVSEVTRRSPQVVGTAFKSVLLSFQQLREGSAEELNAFSSKVEEAFRLGGVENISIFDDNGRLREAKDIMVDLGKEWDGMTREARALISEAVAGKEQAETFQAFLDNQDRYNELLETAYDSAGVAARQQLIYMDSINAKIEGTKNAWQSAADAIIDTDFFKGMLDQATKFLEIIGAQESGIAALGTALLPLAGIFTQVFGSRFVADAFSAKNAKDFAENVAARLESEGKLTDELRKQLDIGEEQQNIVRALGDHAGQIYKQTQEQAKELSEELKIAERSYENMADAAKQAVASLNSGNSLPNFNSNAITKAGNEAVANLQLPDELEIMNQRRKEAEEFKATIESISADKLNYSFGKVHLATKATKDELLVLKGVLDSSTFVTHDILRLQEEIDALLDEEVLSQEDVEAVKKMIAKSSKSLLEDEKEILEVAKAQTEELKKQVREEAKIAEAQRQIQDTVRSPEAIRQEMDLANASATQFEKAAEKSMKWQKATQLLGASATAAVPMMASLKATMEGSISPGEMLQTTLQSVGTSLLFMPHPAAKVIGILTMLIGTFADFRSEAEKTKEINEDLQRSYISLAESTNKALQDTISFEEEYRRIQSSGVDASRILSEGTEEAKEAYKSLAESVANSSPELVKYYNSEGVAIIDLAEDYDTLIAKKREEARATEGILAQNRDSFISQYEAEMINLTNDRTEATKNLKEAQDKLKKSQEMGDQEGIKEALKNIQEYSTAIADAQSNSKLVRDAIQANIISPITSSSEAITRLSTEAPEAADALRDLTSFSIDSEWISTLASRGQGDDIKSLTDNISDLVEELGSLEPSKIEEVVAGLKKIQETNPAGFAMAMQQGKSSIDQMVESVKKGNEAFGFSSEEMVKQVQEAQRLTEEYNKVRETIDENTESHNALAFAGGAAGAVIAGATVALAPFTAGLSLAAGAALIAGGAVAGTATSLVVHSDKIEENIKLMKKAEKARKAEIDILEDISGAYEQSSKTVEGYNANLEQVKNIDKQRKAILKLKEEVESLGNASLEDPSEKLDDKRVKYLTEQYEALEAKQSAAIAGMMMNNTDYYDQWLITNEDAIEDIKAKYDVDAANFSTLAEFKTALQAQSASQFAIYEQNKAMSAHSSADEQQKAAYFGVSNITGYYDAGVNRWLSAWNYFGSESLTIGDKVKLAFLIVIDGLSALAEGAVNTVIGFWNSVVNWIYDGVDKLMEFLKPLQDSYAKIFGGPSGQDHIDMMKKAREADTYEPVDFKTDRATEFAQEATTRNQQNKDEFISEVIEQSNIPAFEAFNGFNKTGEDLKLPGAGTTSETENGNDPNGGKDKEKEVEDLELELDRYYKIENVLSRIEDKMETLSRLKEEAYGQNKINLMAKEQAQYAAQEKALKSYVQALQQEQAEKRKILGNSGFKFDSTGEITNLNARLTALQNAANKKTGEAKEQAIERVKELQEEAQRYSEITFDLIPDKKQALEEAKSAIRELEREKLEYKVELKIEKSEMLTEVRDLMKELNGEEYGKIDENMLITGDQLKANLDLVKYYQSMINEVNKNQKLSDADRQELLKEYNSEMRSAISEAKSAYDELGELQLDFISQTSDMISEIGDGFERIADKAATLADAYKEAYGPQAYQEVSRLREVQLKTIDAQALAATKARDEMLVYRNSLKEGSEAWKEATEIINDLGDQIQDALVDKIDLLKEKFQEFMDQVLLQSEKDIFGALGLDEYTSSLEGVYADQDKMLNTFDKITQVGAMIAEINQAISNSTDPAQAEAYAKFRDKELQSLMSADEVSKAQLERAQLLWDLEQKKQALEDRKNASRMAQLVRDENGNMSYEYVAQQTGPENSKAQADVVNSQKALYDFDREQAKLAQQAILKIMADAEAKIKEYYADETLTDAERQAAIEKVKADSIKELQKAQSEMVSWTGTAIEDGIGALKGMFQLGNISFAPLGLDDESVKKVFDALDAGTITIADIMSGNIGNFAEQIGITAQEANSIVAAIVESTGGEITTITEQLTQVSNQWVDNFNQKIAIIEEAYTSTQEQISNTTDALTGATGNLNAEVDANTAKAIQNTKAIREQAAQMTASTKTVEGNTKAFANLTTTLVGKDGGSGTYGSMIKLRDEMNKKLQGAISETERRSAILSKTAGKDGTTKALNLMAGGADYAFKMSKQFDSGTIRVANQNIDNMSGLAGKASSNIKDMGDKALKSRESIAGLSVALAALPGLDSNKKHYYTITAKDGSVSTKAYTDKPKNSPGAYIGYFDTGGYTGEWAGSSGNQEGRPAILHEKEIVLNKEDTFNFLKGIELQRSMLRAVGGMENFANMFATSGNGSGEIQQSVVIQAEFPNVSSSTEIQDALSSLSLQAVAHAFNRQNQK